MGQTKSGPPPIVFILGALLLGGGGYYFYTQKAATGTTATAPTAAAPTTTPAANSSPLTVPDSLPAGSSVRVDGSTSMVVLNLKLGAAFKAKFPGVNYSWKANGSSKGLSALIAGNVEVAASSRALKDEEVSQGLVAVPVKTDAVAILVGKANPFKGSLSSDQLRSIFSGQVKNWSQVGGTPLPLRVINRNPSSGTYKLLQDSVLGGGAFGSGPNWVTMQKDVTTELLQKLGTNGIGYANYAEIKNQQTVRALPIDDQLPGTDNYPFPSVLYYVYRTDASDAAKAFVAFAASPEGQAIAAQN